MNLPKPPSIWYFVIWAAIFAVIWLGGVAIGDYVKGLQVLGEIVAVVGFVAMAWVLFRTYRIFRARRVGPR